MADITPYFSVLKAKTKLKVSCLKTKKGHDGEGLFSCKIKFKNKHIADYQDLDLGNPNFADITVVNQELYDEAIKELNKLDLFDHKKLNKKVKITMMNWTHAACVYADVEKKAKREKPIAYFNEVDKTIRVFKKTSDHTVEVIQDHMGTMKNIVPFHSLEQEKVTKYYLEMFSVAM